MKKKPAKFHSVWDYVTKSQLDFESFCKIPVINRLYSDIFLKEFDLKKFSVVGFTDDLPKFKKSMREKFDADLLIGFENTTVDPEYASARAHYLDDKSNRARLIKYFERDVAIYEELRTLHG